MKRGKKKIVDYFYRIVHRNGDDIKIPYEFKPGEKEEYIATCEKVDGWGGIPLDVPWAKSTNSYIEALKTHKDTI